MIKAITDYLDQSAVRYPGKMAFEDVNIRLTYADLQKAAYQIAYYLIGKQLLHKPIAIFMEKNVGCIASFFGVAYSGNFYSMMDVNAPAKRIQSILENLEPAAIITNRINLKKADEIRHGAELLLYEDMEEEAYYTSEIIDIASQIKGSDILYIMYTSGSTGKPKGVVTSHQAVIEYIEAASNDYLNITDQDVFGNQYPFFYIASIDDIYLPVRNGASTVIIPPALFYSPRKLVDYLIEKKINVINWVPSALAIIANYDALNGVDLSGIRKVIFGGELIAAKVLNYWQRALPDAVFINGYGATETTEGTTYYIVDRTFKDTDEIPLGKPMNHVEIFLIDQSGNEVMQGEIGEMYVRTSALSNGYYRDIGKTVDTFVQNPINKKYLDIVYKTGDFARQDRDGNFIYIGRIDEQIKINGHRIELEDIEKNALEIEGVDECICLYQKEKNELALYYRGKAQGKIIYECLREKMPVFMIPSRYYKIKEFPLNANGKIDKILLMSLSEDI